MSLTLSNFLYPFFHSFLKVSRLPDGNGAGFQGKRVHVIFIPFHIENMFGAKPKSTAALH